jgi:hypothetical protein
VRRYRFLVTVPVEVRAENVAQARRLAKAMRMIGPSPSGRPATRPRLDAVAGGGRPGPHDRDHVRWTISVYPVSRVERVDDEGPEG